MAHILIIGGHEESFKLIEGLDFRLALFQNEDGISDFQRSMAKNLEIFDYTDSTESQRRAKILHSKEPLDAVLSFTEYGLTPAADITSALGIRGNSPKAIYLTRDKFAMREALLGSTVGTTRFKKCRSLQEAKDFFMEVGGDVILKPATGSGSSGVHRVRNVDTLEDLWHSSQSEHSGPTIFEEYIDGPEYSAECLTRRGKHEVIAITEKITTGAPRYVEVAHHMPAPLSADAAKEIESVVVRFLKLIDMTIGAAHVEIRRSSKGVRIIEGNTRAGGDFIWELVYRAMGVNLIRETILDVLDLPTQRNKGAGAGSVTFFTYENVTVRSITGIEEAKKLPGIIRLHCSLKNGLHLGPLLSSDSRQGAMVAVGKDLTEARYSITKALSMIKIETDSTHA